ncbi:MAG: rod shape-determining protein MreC [Bacilli bacterium]|nr:rod shape-determining protein MreC [Bacilli bacterium]
MYKKKKDKHKENIMLIIGGIIVIVLLVLSLLVSSSNNYVLKDTAMFIERIVMYPFTALRKDSKNECVVEKNSNKEMEKEIEELKEVLELNKTLTEHKAINATVLSRNKSYWFNTITIDKGKKSGIKKNMAVITKKGLIGKISKVSNNSSEIKLITSDDINFKVSVAIRTGDRDNYAVLNGYDHDTGLIKVTGIDKTTVINQGDTVLTSGLGEMFPAGIYIGAVEKEESDKYNLSKTLYIKTTQDFNNIHYVSVLGEK